MPDMEHIIIKKPRDWDSLDESSAFKKYTENRKEVMKYIQEITENGYLHWEKARFTDPPEGLTRTEAWFIVREIRKASSRNTPVKIPSGENFTLMRPLYTDKLLRDIDMYAGGNFMFERSHTTESAKAERQKFLTRGIIEEAIASAQLEGASTTRRYAKKMLAENKKPTNKSEWMILNNYKTLQAIDENYKNQDLSMAVLLELQSAITENTIESDEVGRLRKDSDEIVVTYRGKIAHVPPNEAFVKQELDRLIKYANDTEHFVHPVIKAIIIHFWIGYLHPFTDGNGRLARSLFYWYMLKNNYWAIPYLPISMVIKRAPQKYTYAYIYTEQDNLDLTYFFDYNLWKIKKTIDEFISYTNRIETENKQIESRLKTIVVANDRQKQMVHYLLADTSHYVTITTQMTTNGVSRGTARSDIHSLEECGLLVSRRAGTSIQYVPSDKLLGLN